MNLREALGKRSLERFIKTREKQHTKASHKHFHGAVKSMASKTAKPKRGTSKKGSRGN